MAQKQGNINSFFTRLALKSIPAWVTPNSLSVLRLAIIPLIICLMALGYYGWSLAWFIIASLLDVLDGTLARGRGQISDLGLILDPLADKLLIMAIIGSLLLLYPFKLLIIYAFIFDLLILLVSVIKVSQAKNTPQPAIKPSNLWGKSKMLAQVSGLILVFFWLIWPIYPLLYASAIVIWLSLALQIKSAISYA